VDLRGRGESAYAKDPMTYVPLTYLQDMEALIRELALPRFVLFGTSLGGLVSMLLAMAGDTRVAAALINDIGPVLDPRGLDRIRSHVGRSQSWPTWMHAARHFAEVQREVFPDWQLEHWLVFAKRLCRLGSNGRIVFDYDMRIAEPFKLPGGATGFDLWRAFAGLKGVPSLIVRGASSDLLTEETLAAMLQESPATTSVTVPRVGHAPTLEEPEAAAAIDALLERVK
jgi:pimeloyl-ACP methyl ester carboxylesterase